MAAVPKLNYDEESGNVNKLLQPGTVKILKEKSSYYTSSEKIPLPIKYQKSWEFMERYNNDELMEGFEISENNEIYRSTQKFSYLKNNSDKTYNSVSSVASCCDVNLIKRDIFLNSNDDIFKVRIIPSDVHHRNLLPRSGRSTSGFKGAISVVSSDKSSTITAKIRVRFLNETANIDDFPGTVPVSEADFGDFKQRVTGAVDLVWVGMHPNIYPNLTALIKFDECGSRIFSINFKFYDVEKDPDFQISVVNIAANTDEYHQRCRIFRNDRGLSCISIGNHGRNDRYTNLNDIEESGNIEPISGKINVQSKRLGPLLGLMIGNVFEQDGVGQTARNVVYSADGGDKVNTGDLKANKQGIMGRGSVIYPWYAAPVVNQVIKMLEEDGRRVRYVAINSQDPSAFEARYRWMGPS